MGPNQGIWLVFPLYRLPLEFHRHQDLPPLEVGVGISPNMLNVGLPRGYVALGEGGDLGYAEPKLIILKGN